MAGKGLLSMGLKAEAEVKLGLGLPSLVIRGRFHPLFTRHPPLWLRGRITRAGVSSLSRADRTMAKIILAEDDNDMRRFLVKALQNAGYDVISFDNGLSAYQRLREEPFELL